MDRAPGPRVKAHKNSYILLIDDVHARNMVVGTGRSIRLQTASVPEHLSVGVRTHRTAVNDEICTLQRSALAPKIDGKRAGSSDDVDGR